MAAERQESTDGILFLSIVGGKFSQKVSKDTPGAKYRLHIDKQGKEYPKYEILYNNVSGMISKLVVEAGKYNDQLLIELVDTDNITKIWVSVKSPYFKTFCKRLPNIDLTKPVILSPYDFIPKDREYSLTGITVSQDGSKLQNYYWDPVTKKATGLPKTVKPWEEMTRTEKDASNLIQTAYFIESVGLLAKGIPAASELFNKQEEAPDFFDVATQGNQGIKPDLS